jgi:hypothetical protein
MNLEKRFYAVPPQILTADGTSYGLITIPDTSLFKVKQHVFISNAGSNTQKCEIKRIDSHTTLYVGPVGGSIDDRFDTSFLLVSAGANIYAVEQAKSKVPEHEIERYTYIEEPVCARRVHMVDHFGDSFTTSNPVPVNIIEQPPFAQPTYRTKHTASDSIVVVAADSYENIDLLLTEERYISGGTLIVENPQLGDYVTTEIVDLDDVIPEAYRPILCENWPTVARYIEKEWIEVNASTCVRQKIDTSPLNARVTAGLYLRVTYHAINSGSSRNIGINYYLTKKL